MPTFGTASNHHTFVIDPLDAGDPDALEPWFQDLLKRELPDSDTLERWLLDESDLLSRCAAENARRYIARTCDTKDTECEARYRQFHSEVMPKLRSWSDALDQKFLSAPAADQLDVDRYAVLKRKRKAASELFRDENTALQTEESELQAKQQAIMGGITVEFDGEKRTLQAMAPFAQSQDRTLRQRAFNASFGARDAHRDELHSILDAMVQLRTKIAHNADQPDYVAYRFRDLERFDYTPADCERFHDAVEKAVVPAIRRLDQERQQKLGVDALRPYDLEVDLTGAAAFKPFATEAELIDLAKQAFAKVDPRFRSEFEILEQNNLLDLMSREGKAPGGYQYGLEDIRLPFIFANAVGTHADLQTLLHEGGHAFHSLLCRDEPLTAYRHSPIEFAETASMSMELMALEEMDGIYSSEDATRERRKHLEGILRVLTWIVSIDAQQLWLYRNPESTLDDRVTHWRSLRNRFAPTVDYSGIEAARDYQWLYQQHLFSHPLYYIEYGIAQVAALQIWRRYRDDKKATVAAYREALALGGTRPLPKLFETAGVDFDLSPEKLSELVADIA